MAHQMEEELPFFLPSLEEEVLFMLPLFLLVFHLVWRMISPISALSFIGDPSWKRKGSLLASSLEKMKLLLPPTLKRRMVLLLLFWMPYSWSLFPDLGCPIWGVIDPFESHPRRRPCCPLDAFQSRSLLPIILKRRKVLLLMFLNTLYMGIHLLILDAPWDGIWYFWKPSKKEA